jgi:hypothetical protein
VDVRGGFRMRGMLGGRIGSTEHVESACGAVVLLEHMVGDGKVDD